MSACKILKREDLPLLINELGLKKGVEIGVHKGHFSEHILANSNIETFYSVDAWIADEKATRSARKHCEKIEDKMEECYKETVDKLAKFGKRSVIIRDLSENAVKMFENESLDFVYLDASHRFTGFTLDLINWWEKTKWGGVFSGHDYCRKYRYEVMYGVNGFCAEHKQLFYLTTEERQFPQFEPSWWLIKTKRDRHEYKRDLVDYKKIINEQSKIIKEVKSITTDIPYEFRED